MPTLPKILRPVTPNTFFLWDLIVVDVSKKKQKGVPLEIKLGTLPGKEHVNILVSFLFVTVGL